MKLSVATRKGLFELSSRSSNEWNVDAVHFVGDPVTAALHDSENGRTIAALRMGHFGVKLRVSNDHGKSWEEVASPMYPPKPEGIEDSNPWTLDQVWIFEGFHSKLPQRLWAGTNPGGLFRSDDGGRSWSLIESLWNMPERKQWMGGGYDIPGIHSICVHPDDPDDIVVGVSCGGAWRTRDGGKTWTVGQGMRATFMPPEGQMNPVIQDPHRIVQCKASPDVLWTQHHCGIWKSTDRGAHWSEVTTARPSSFGFAVVVHPRDADTAWFMPLVSDEKRVPVNGGVVATRTRDGGASFDVLQAGLPQRDAYDVVYRHGLDIAEDGAHLVAGSTTGSLWVSADSGESWQTVGVNLPPIYATRFI
ncbi:MAG: WD40/YVTN/BNR-like repeat-containing protein [Burkholderiaceae bacterium]